jgi:hypothetical protein
MLIGGAQLDNPAAPLSDLPRFGLQTKPGEVALLSAVRSLTGAHELLPLLRDQQPTVPAMIPAALSALIHDHDLRPGQS